MPRIDEDVESVRASRAGHAFHERWAARRALQLVFPNDNLSAIAVEGISSTETAKPGAQAEEVADLVLYYGQGNNFNECERLETVQFKYKVREEAVTASYLKKTIEKFSATIIGYEKDYPASSVDNKASFIFVTNSRFKDSLWEAIQALVDGKTPVSSDAATQYSNLQKWCANQGLLDSSRLFRRTVFRAGEKSLAAQDNALKRTLTDWSAGADLVARGRILGLQELVLRKAGPSGQGKNLILREDVLDALDCEPEDLFPAETRFIDVGDTVERAELKSASDLLKQTDLPVFIHAEGGVGKTVFVQSLAKNMTTDFEVVLFDCFGGGSYRSENHARHLPRVGLIQIINELASRTLCDPILPNGDDSRKIIRAACKRLEQAANAIRTQSKKLGLIIIIDAADNAQLEAEYRHEESFPKRLLAALNDEPIDGVKLVLTARPYRKDKVIERSKVTEIELGPFTIVEAREFLKSRKPDADEIEITTALARSGRNARVLDYLVQTWETNILEKNSTDSISVPEIIAERCSKIISELHIAGWSDSDITEFFVALSLLPPPIPLEELAQALGWSIVQVRTAASDLAPMLEITSHGAIFRDEPTESYIRDTFSERAEAQIAIAERLLASQKTSTYAAEALPHFLVVIKDSDRAFELADSSIFPTSIQSEFGRRRLILARLRAAFRLAVAEDDFDRVLGLSMRLGQVATANMRGDEFIRRSPALAIVLGDSDSYRRLFSDRSGWRGARSARLTVAYHFAGDSQEAQIQCESTVRWINWHVKQPRDEHHPGSDGPEICDFSAVLFHHVVQGSYSRVDKNIDRWNYQLSMSASEELLELLALYDQVNHTTLLGKFVLFIASEDCTSLALKLSILSHPHYVQKDQVILLSNQIIGITSPLKEVVHPPTGLEQRRSYIADAALTALFSGLRPAAKAMVRRAQLARPAAYEYSERFGHTSIWGSILSSCIAAWSVGKAVSYCDLLPREVKIGSKAKAISTRTELLIFLKDIKEPIPKHARVEGDSKKERLKFKDHEHENISKGIDITLELIRPIEHVILTQASVTEIVISEFVQTWRKHLRNNTQWQNENAADSLVRSVGFGCMSILLDHALTLSPELIQTITDAVAEGKFVVTQKIHLLKQISHYSNAHAVAGNFAQHIAQVIRQDDNISQRGNTYVTLASSITHISIDEAREYYRQGLAQLDQLGGESYDSIYALLEYASAQRGGHLKPTLAQRFMNLCQPIISYDARKFGWTGFARAAAQSIGVSAIAKLVRWHDQDLADFSYGLPQLACYLAENGSLDPRRAAFILTLCEDHGWWDWRSGEAVATLIKSLPLETQKTIYHIIISNLKNQYPSGGWPTLWEGFLKTADQFQNLITPQERADINQLWLDSKQRQDEFNNRNNSTRNAFDTHIQNESEEAEELLIIDTLVKTCNPTLANSIDHCLKKITQDEKLSYKERKRFIEKLSTSCPYSKRLDFLMAVCEAQELDFTQSLKILNEYYSAWNDSSIYLASSTRPLVEKLFESKSTDLFDDQFSNINRDLRKLSDFCGDKHFVLRLTLQKIAADEVEFGGEEWIQLSTALCDLASGQACLDSLEFLLSGPTARIADEIGEGPLRPEQEICLTEENFVADLIWHLLGNDDAYIRWNVARGISSLFELGLTSEVTILLENFDRREIKYLESTDLKLSFQNSQQWLLMGLARAALHHGSSISSTKQKLTSLAQREDLHIINKLHAVRCLRNICDETELGELAILFDPINRPPLGVVTDDSWPAPIKSTSEFHFDYEFSKHDVSTLARLFNISDGVVEDAIAAEITRLWPMATSMDFFPGRERHYRDHGNRFESYREHIQRHALISAATNLSKNFPIVIRSYDCGVSPWQDWRDCYDVTFDDGSWLSDHKDSIPEEANENLLGERANRQVTLHNQEVLTRKLGYDNSTSDALFPLYGRWTSPDGVIVKITSALSQKSGVIGRCQNFAKQNSHDIWLPEFWDDGFYDYRHRKDSPFSPLVWKPEHRDIGIDVTDEIAAECAAERPRLGIDITKHLGLVNDLSGNWCTENGDLAMHSKVWGSWKPDPDNHRTHFHDNGEILYASNDWLAKSLSALNKKLVFTINLWKPKPSRSYETSNEIKSLLVGLRLDDGTVRIWPAVRPSKKKKQ